MSDEIDQILRRLEQLPASLRRRFTFTRSESGLTLHRGGMRILLTPLAGGEVEFACEQPYEFSERLTVVAAVDVAAAWLNDNSFCECNDAWKCPGREVTLHADVQDTSSDAWKRLLDLIEDTAAHDREDLSPGSDLTPEDWSSIVTLPQSISKLKSVRRLVLVGSSLVRIPPEIGQMGSLERFDAYRSYRLHWLPYEITRCTELKSSRISTRALYGNFKHRNPFPDLRVEASRAVLPSLCPSTCSVCDRPFADASHFRWISLAIATDVVPLLAAACSMSCIDSLPEPPDGYVKRPHQGGRALEQPPRHY